MGALPPAVAWMFSRQLHLPDRAEDVIPIAGYAIPTNGYPKHRCQVAHTLIEVAGVCVKAIKVVGADGFEPPTYSV